MGLLDSVIGAMAGGRGGMQGGGAAQSALLNVVLAMLANRAQGQGGAGAAAASSGGGLGELVRKFTQGGLGDVIGSWIGRGQNAPISGSQLSNVLGPDAIGNIAAQLGLTHAEAADQVSQVLPQVVDQLTPDGQVPDGGLGSIDDILARFSKP